MHHEGAELKTRDACSTSLQNCAFAGGNRGIFHRSSLR